jgi:hypothetical protein
MCDDIKHFQRYKRFPTGVKKEKRDPQTKKVSEAVFKMMFVVTYRKSNWNLGQGVKLFIIRYFILYTYIIFLVFF